MPPPTVSWSSLPKAKGLMGDVLSLSCSDHSECRDAGGAACDARMGRCRCKRHYYAYRDEQCLPGKKGMGTTHGHGGEG